MRLSVLLKITVVVAIVGLTSALSWAADGGASDSGVIDAIKNPMPGLTLSFDQRLREIWGDKFIIPDRSSANHEYHFQRIRSRLGAKWSMFEDVDVNARLIWEWRNWCKPDSRDSNVEFDEALFDTLNVQVRNAFDLPLTITAGRQDLIFGNGWLILDGTPLDGSRTIFFDAVRFNYQLDEATSVDLIYVDQKAEADGTFEPINDQERGTGLIDQDERGAILYVKNNSWLPNTKTDVYAIWKHELPCDAGVGTDAQIYTFGARVDSSLSEQLKGRAEFAQQLGEYGDSSGICAFGFNSRLTYLLKDSWDSQLRFNYEFLSGDDPDTAKNEQFNSLWGRWPQFSELYVYTYLPESRIGDVTNLHRVGGGWTGHPTEKIELCADYHLLYADENTVENRAAYSSGHFRGQLITAMMKYKINKHLSGHFLAESFLPGGYYEEDTQDPAYFLRYELMITF